MSAEGKRGTKGTYHSPVREEQARITRQRIARAARSLFLKQGYAGTRLRQIAEEAEVSEQTIYAVYQNKRGLLLAIIDDMATHAGVEETMRHLAEANGNPDRELQVYLTFDRRLFEREGSTLRILRDAGNAEPEFARTYVNGRNRAWERHMRAMLQWQERGELSPDLTAEQGADIYHAVSSIDTFSYLVDERGWSPEQWEHYTYRLLSASLLRGQREDP